MEGLQSENLIQKFLQEYTARKALVRPIIPDDSAPPILYNNDFLVTSLFPPTVPVAPAPTPTLVHLETTTVTPNRSQTDTGQNDRQKGLPTAENEKAFLAILASKLRPAGEAPPITNLGHQVLCPRYSNLEAPADNCPTAESETQLGQQVAIPLGPHHDKLPDKCNIAFQSNYVKMVQGSYLVSTRLDHGYSFVLKDTTTPTSTSKDVSAKLMTQLMIQHDWQNSSSRTDSDSDVESDQAYEDLVAKLHAASSEGSRVSASGPDRKNNAFHPDLVVTSIDALVLERMNAIELAIKNEKLAAEARAVEAASPRPASSPTKKKTAAARKAEDKSAKLEPREVKEKPAAKGKKTAKDKLKTSAPTSPLLHQMKAATPPEVPPPVTPPSLVHCYAPSRLALQPNQPATCVPLNYSSLVFDPKIRRVLARFLLEGKEQLLGVPPGQFILMTISTAERRKLCRPVFPASPCDSLGFVDVIWDLQAEPTRQTEALPASLSFGRALLQVKAGDPVMVSGPYGQLLYLKSGWISHQQRFSRPKATKQYKHVLFFGTTFVALPYFAMVEQACRERAPIQFTLLHIGFTENDFMMEEKLKELANASPAICQYYPTLLGSAICSDWKEELQDSLVAKFLPPSTDGFMIVVCANPSFARNYLLPALDAVGMDEETVDRYVYGDVGRDFTASSI